MLTKEIPLDIQEKRLTQSANSLWHMLHRMRITASKFGLVTRQVRDFENLIKQLNPSQHVVTAPMRWGIELEPKAAMAYANKAKGGSVNLFLSGLIQPRPQGVWSSSSSEWLQSFWFIRNKGCKGGGDWLWLCQLSYQGCHYKWVYFEEYWLLLLSSPVPISPDWCWMVWFLFLHNRWSFCLCENSLPLGSQKQGGQFLFSTLFKLIWWAVVGWSYIVYPLYQVMIVCKAHGKGEYWNMQLMFIWVYVVLVGPKEVSKGTFITDFFFNIEN